MTAMVSVDLLVEDVLSEAAARKAIETSNTPLVVGVAHGKQGNGYIKKRISNFNRAAQGSPFFVLTDLDNTPCASSLIEEWLPEPKHPNLLFRVAVREVEAWLLADRERFSRFIGRSASQLPLNPDAESDPKHTIVSLARRSSKRSVREGIPPRPHTTAKIGPLYNEILTEFVFEKWKPRDAAERSVSLSRCLQALDNFWTPSA